MSKKAKDREATNAAKFEDQRSRINLDGTVELHGKDMQILREVVFGRDDYKCRECGSEEWLHMHHVIPRGSSGVDRDDTPRNTITLCVHCHAKKHVRVKHGGNNEKRK